MKVNCQHCNEIIERVYIKNVLYTCSMCKKIINAKTAGKTKREVEEMLNREKNLEFISNYKVKEI